LTLVAARVEPLCSHVSVRDDEAGHFLLAIDSRVFHSLEVRATEQGFVVEFWRGPANEDDLVSESHYEDLASAQRAVEAWLQGNAV
jgi:hypothetical protein